MQIFNYINSLLLDLNIHMKLTPYNINACSKIDGFLEFIKESETISSILKK